MPTKKSSKPAAKRPPREGRQLNLTWTHEEHAAAHRVAKSVGLSVTDLVRMSVAAKCLELAQEISKLDRPAMQIPLVRANMEGVLAMHMSDEALRLAEASSKKKN